MVRGAEVRGVRMKGTSDRLMGEKGVASVGKDQHLAPSYLDRIPSPAIGLTLLPELPPSRLAHILPLLDPSLGQYPAIRMLPRRDETHFHHLLLPGRTRSSPSLRPVRVGLGLGLWGSAAAAAAAPGETIGDCDCYLTRLNVGDLACCHVGAAEREYE